MQALLKAQINKTDRNYARGIAQMMRAALSPGADSEEKHEPVSDIDTVVVDSLRALDPEWPIREADIVLNSGNVRLIRNTHRERAIGTDSAKWREQQYSCAGCYFTQPRESRPCRAISN